METNKLKCVMVVDGDLAAGLAANTAAILGATLGKSVPEIVGPDVRDAQGRVHRGIVCVPVPILRGDEQSLQALREKLSQPDFADLVAVDFSDVAQGCNVYEEYQEKMLGEQGRQARYFGIGLCGEKRKVNRLTGSLPLLR